MNIRPGQVFLYFLLLSLLSACGPSQQEREHSANQEYYFLESLRQVETGGRQLQSTGLSQQALTQALGMLDQGLKHAFQVERKFLDELDLRLGKNYQRYFVAGVENYRLGIEAGDEDQQREGLQLLSRWSVFWTAEQQAIKSRLNPG